MEAKLITSVGEAVYGEPLPPNVIKQPTTSFSAQGYFIGIVKPPPQGNHYMVLLQSHGNNSEGHVISVMINYGSDCPSKEWPNDVNIAGPEVVLSLYYSS